MRQKRWGRPITHTRGLQGQHILYSLPEKRTTKSNQVGSISPRDLTTEAQLTISEPKTVQASWLTPFYRSRFKPSHNKATLNQNPEAPYFAVLRTFLHLSFICTSWMTPAIIRSRDSYYFAQPHSADPPTSSFPTVSIIHSPIFFFLFSKFSVSSSHASPVHISHPAASFASFGYQFPFPSSLLSPAVHLAIQN